MFTVFYTVKFRITLITAFNSFDGKIATVQVDAAMIHVRSNNDYCHDFMNVGLLNIKAPFCLHPFVECIWLLKSHSSFFNKREIIIPGGRVEMIFNLGSCRLGLTQKILQAAHDTTLSHAVKHFTKTLEKQRTRKSTHAITCWIQKIESNYEKPLLSEFFLESHKEYLIVNLNDDRKKYYTRTDFKVTLTN